MVGGGFPKHPGNRSDRTITILTWITVAIYAAAFIAFLLLRVKG